MQVIFSAYRTWKWSARAFYCQAQSTGRRKRNVEHWKGEEHRSKQENPRQKRQTQDAVASVEAAATPVATRVATAAPADARTDNSGCTVRVASHSSTQDNTDYPAASVLANNADNDATPHNFWLGEVGDHIIFDLGCKKEITGIILKNTRRGQDNNAGTKEFSFWTSDSATGSWSKIFDGVMTTAIGTDPVQIQDITSDAALTVHFVKFQIEGIYGTMGGLQYIAFKEPTTTTTTTSVTTTTTTTITAIIITTTPTASTTTTPTTTTTTAEPWMAPHETIREVTCVPWKWTDTTYWKWDLEVPEHCYSESPLIQGI